MGTTIVSYMNKPKRVTIVNVHLPKDRVSMAHQGYGFCEFLTEEDAEYACKIMNQIKLYGKPIRVNKVSMLDYGLELHYIPKRRRLPIKSNWTLEPICLLVILTKMWMSVSCTIHSARLA